MKIHQKVHQKVHYYLTLQREPIKKSDEKKKLNPNCKKNENKLLSELKKRIGEGRDTVNIESRVKQYKKKQK